MSAIGIIIAIVLLVVILIKLSSLEGGIQRIHAEFASFKKQQVNSFEKVDTKKEEEVELPKAEMHNKYMPATPELEPEPEISPEKEEYKTPLVTAIEEEPKKEVHLKDNAWEYWGSTSQEKKETKKETTKSSVKTAKVETSEETKYKKPAYGESNTKNSFDLERFFSENLLSKIGIVTLVLGITYLIKYSIDQNWINEIARVGIGFLVGAGIIGVAHKIKRQNSAFSAILVGGGIAVLYITTVFAYQEYNLIPQTPAFAIMIIITAFSVLLSILYNRKELAIFSLLGGFASPLLVSSGMGNYIVLFSYILILNSGMLIVAHKKNWNIVGKIAYALTIIFLWGWIFKCPEEDKTGTIIFAFLFFIQFYVLAIIDYLKQEKLTIVSAVILLANNISLFAACIVLMDEKYRGVLSVALALINVVPLAMLYKRDKVDTRLIFLLIAIVLSFITLAVPLQLRGRAITMFWAVETCILLLLWIKSKQSAFGVGFIIIYILAVGAWLMDIEISMYKYNSFCNLNIDTRLFITGAVLTAATFANYFMLARQNAENKPLISINSKPDTFADILFNFFVALLYIVPLIEIIRAADSFTNTLLYTSIVAYTYTFIAIYTLINWNKNKQGLFQILLAALIIFPITLLINFRKDILYYGAIQFNAMPIHLIGLAAVVVICFYLLKYKKPHNTNIVYWVITAVAMLTLGVEAKNIGAELFATSENYYEVINVIWHAAYSIIWGIMAICIIVYGIKNKIPTLRKIALSVLGLVILKLYVIDIWNMKPTGRIVAFIVLGVVLLSSSFLIQKVKKLISENETDE